jgi:hypothetical protein
LQAGRLTQVVEHLPSKYMVLSSNLVLPKKILATMKYFKIFYTFSMRALRHICKANVRCLAENNTMD